MPPGPHAHQRSRGFADETGGRSGGALSGDAGGRVGEGGAVPRQVLGVVDACVGLGRGGAGLGVGGELSERRPVLAGARAGGTRGGGFVAGAVVAAARVGVVGGQFTGVVVAVGLLGAVAGRKRRAGRASRAVAGLVVAVRPARRRGAVLGLHRLRQAAEGVVGVGGGGTVGGALGLTVLPNTGLRSGRCWLRCHSLQQAVVPHSGRSAVG